MFWVSTALLLWGAWETFWSPRLLARFRLSLAEAGRWPLAAEEVLAPWELRIRGLLWICLGILGYCSGRLS